MRGSNSKVLQILSKRQRRAPTCSNMFTTCLQNMRMRDFQVQCPYGREVPLPKRCKYHKNVWFHLQTVEIAQENISEGFCGHFFLMPYIFLIPCGLSFLVHPEPNPGSFHDFREVHAIRDLSAPLRTGRRNSVPWTPGLPLR